MNAKTIVPLVIALVLGVISAKLGRDMIVKRRAEEAKVKMVRVVLATADLPPGSVLHEEHLAAGAIPDDGSGISRYTFARPADVVGRVVLTQLVKGQPVLETLLAPKGAGGGAQAMIPEGMRAVTVEVNEYNGVAGLLVPGCQVDVVHTLKFRSEGGGDGELLSRTIVENLRVLAVGRRTSAANAAAKGPEPEQPARSVTLLVTQHQAELIDLVTHVGQPRLVLRNGLDQRVGGGKGVTLAELRGPGGKAPANDPLAGMVHKIFGGDPPATRPVDQTSPKIITGQSAGDSNFRNVEVIRAGASSTVRVNAPPKPALAGNENEPAGEDD